ncbi:unnamed protein product [Rotaria magnacalcarata]|uniref:RING-type domain-containing protein n=1 Tax=Rotaria magnacalcarata TaxID=392030 RepID=A0A817A6A5_9BILA|nr:unnamed protein product [Rotaria magnacalcarata]
MSAAGFQYIGNYDTARCNDCGLEASSWTLDMNPFTIHSQRSPDCPFVCSARASSLSNPSISTASTINTSALEESENQPKRRKIDTGASKPIPCTLLEAHSLQEVRRRTFSHWSHSIASFLHSIIEAGFFGCNVDDRIICIYCNLICQQWIPRADDPCEVHKTLSPNCPYVKSKLTRPAISSINVGDENCGSNDNPLIEHARWFPQCTYARQLCGEELYHQVQEPRLAQYESAKGNETNGTIGPSAILNNNLVAHTQQSLMTDERTLAIFVAARLDLPISRRLSDQNFNLSIVKQCWEDQLRLKHDDFLFECDLYMACLIRQKQIEHIDIKKENIVVPSIKMKQIREEIAGMHEQTVAIRNRAQTTDDRKQSTLSNPCVLCLTEEKRFVCIPCGHMAMCVACGHSSSSCPICETEIEAFVRIDI